MSAPVATSPCPRCACNADASAHAVVEALLRDDLDAAMERGLLDAQACARCTDECRAFVHDAREQRRRALDARERYRHRNARLQRRAEERAAQRAVPVAPAATAASVATTPALPSAAAAALARAREKAAQRHKP